MRRVALALALVAGSAAAQPADTLAYRVYTAAGDPAALGDVVAAMQAADVVFLGELHDDGTAHALQLRLLEAADSLRRPVALGLEMFERDVQPVLDEYLAGLVRERDLLAAARPWGTYATDYRPLVEHARARGWPVLATNAPGRYVHRVARLGADSLAALSAEATATLPPLPVAPASDSLAATFVAMMASLSAHGHGAPDATDTTADTTAADSTAADDPAASVHGSAPNMANLLAAQNLRDAAMAWTIARHLDAHPGALVLHVNGSFHSEGGRGIPEHLARYRPGTRALVVTLRPAADDPAADDPPARSGDDFVILTGPAASR